MKEWTKEERYRVLKNREEIVDLHERIKQSQYRQSYHIQPITGLLNDPNGFVFHKDKWHLFYQWCPWGAVHGLKYWYHTESSDLVHWDNKGICIHPDQDFDNKGAYSGSALVTNHSIYLYYTGNHRDEDWKRSSYTCLVNMRDDGTSHKYSKPLFGPHPSYTEHQRDPKIIYRKKEKMYYLLIGAQTADKKGCVIVYKSPYHNKEWTFAGQLNVPGFEDFGDMWECPSIEHIDDCDILIFCPQHLSIPSRGNNIHHNGYIIGHMDYDTLTFTPDGQFHVLDFGFDSYAAECAANINDQKKAILVAWMGLPDASYPTDDEEWSGCLTLPRELTVRKRRLIQRPLKQLETLRDKKIDPFNRELPKCCEIDLRLHGNIDFNLFTKQDGSGGLMIHYDESQKHIYIDRSGMTNRFNKELGESQTRILDHPLNHLQIYIDASSIEIFVNDGDAVFTSRVFPTKEEHFFSIIGEGTMQIYTLKSSNGNQFIV
jgi:beta-fructofuranosidase